MKQRITYISVALFVLLFLTPQVHLSAEPHCSRNYNWEWIWENQFKNNNDYFSGSGTKSDPYLIRESYQLAKLAYDVNVRHNTYRDKYFKLVADINLQDYKIDNMNTLWVPIGIDHRYPFEGYFDGNGKTISGMLMWPEGGRENQFSYGLFGASHGVIRNVNMKGCEINFRYTGDEFKTLYVGALCGYLFYPGAVYGCTADGSFSGILRSSVVDKISLGGIVGYAANPVSIYRCHSGVNFQVFNTSSVGGIVGTICGYDIDRINYWVYHSWEPLESFVFDCTYNGTMNNYKVDWTGGICGLNDGGNIEACGTAGNYIVSYYDELGGICGNNKGNIIACVSVANLSTGRTIGGIAACNRTTTIGDKTYKGLIKYCSFGGRIEISGGAARAGGITGKTEGVHTNCMFTGSMKADSWAVCLPVSKPKTPETPIVNQKCYYDSNIHNDTRCLYPETRIALPTGTMTNGQESSCPFENTTVSSLKNTYNSIGDIEVIGVSYKYEAGFYPRLVISSENNAATGAMTDNVIENARRRWDDQTNLKAPTLFPAYAFIAAVPMAFGNIQKAYDLDMNFPVAEKSSDGFKATYHLPEGQKIIKVENNLAILQDPGTLMITIKSDKGLEKQVPLNITYGQQWDGTYADSYDGGNGSPANPFLIHNARQFAKMMRNNDADEYYKLTQDICFNPQTNAADGTCVDGVKFYDNNPSDKSDCCWRAHLDGDGHLVKGLCAKSRQAIFETLYEGSVIENVGFVDLYVQQPAAYDGSKNGVFANLMRGNAIIRNCIFQGSSESLNPRNGYDGRGLVSNLIILNGNIPVIEDCVVCLMGRQNGLHTALFRYLLDDRDYVNQTPVTTVQRNLILSGENTFAEILEDNNGCKASCYIPKGYYHHWSKPSIEAYERSVEQLTSGNVFTDMDINGRWQEEPGYFPMLKSFAKTDYGRLLSLPFMTSEDNCLNRMKRQMELRFGAQLSVSDPAAFEIDDENTFMAPLKAGKFYVTTTLGRARIVRAVTVDDTFTAGVSFDDEHARTLCQTNFDSDKSGYLSINELRKVDDNQLVAAVNNSQQEAEQIVRFNEFALFRGITQLGTTESAAGARQHRAAAVGTAFHNLKNLKEFRIPESVTTIGDEAFRGCDQLETVTLTQKVSSVSGKAFYNSNVKNILVDNSNPNFKSRDNMLYTKDDDLVCYPNGRKATSITLSGKIRRILKNAIYKVETLDSIFINGESLLDVTDLEKGGIVHYSQEADATEPAMRIFVSDGSFDQRLLKQYKADANWSLYDDNQRIDRYYPLTFNDAKAATMYIGFATQLPAELKVYLADKEMVKGGTVTLLNISKKINNKLGEGTSVVVLSPKEGTYNLLPYKGTDATKIPLYLNALNGVAEQGMRINQSDSNEGNCLTLGRNSQKKLGFYYYKNESVKPFHAYLTANTINARMIDFNENDDLDITDVSDEPLQELDADLYDDLFAYKKSDDGLSCRAVWYYGDDQNINIPAEVDGIPVTALGKNLFYDNDLPVWSVNVPSSIKTLRVARREKDNSFYGLNDSTIVYLPSADAGYTMPDDEWNVVLGDQCKRLYLADGQSFIPPREFYADYVQYGRQLWAETDIAWNYEKGDMEEMDVNHKDGTNEALAREADFDLFDFQYKRMAYSLCLPFDVDLKAMANNDDSFLKAYQLKYVKDNLHFIFVEVAQQLKAGEPYFIVVDGGGYLLLNDQKTKISAQLHPLTITDYNTGAVVGQFKGNLTLLTHDDAIAEHAFVIQRSGNWHRIMNDNEIYKRVKIPANRAYFSRTDSFVRNRYFTNFAKESSSARQRAAGDDGITDFPADAYYSDIDFEVEDDATGINPVIHTIDLDGSERIYDLQGRKLTAKPKNGGYIMNGKKYINK